MSLLQLEANSFRNLQELKIQPSSGLNLIYGDNGSGKTSLLEAIYLLGHGRSFRSHLINRVVQHGENALSVFGRLKTASGRQIALGIQKTPKEGQRIRLDGQNVTAISEIAHLIPTQIINPDSYRLLDSGPKFRRQFLDWGLFHVKQDYFSVWKRFQRALIQRNAALKTGMSRTHIQVSWDKDFIRDGMIMDQYREWYFEAFKQAFSAVYSRLSDIEGVKLTYYRGWRAGLSLEQALLEGFVSDHSVGHTQRGPQRADLKITVNGVPAQDVLSRGQQKTLVFAMRLAQGQLLREQEDKSCLYLIDDIASELDAERQQLVAAVLVDLNAQVFVTGLKEADFAGLRRVEDLNMFHVERGTVQKMV